MVRRLGPWQQRISMLLINGVYAAILNIHWTERITNNEGRSRTQQPYCVTQSAPDAFASLVTSAELTPVRIILWHCTPVLLVCPSTGGEDPAGRDRPGYELSRMIYGHSICMGLATAQRRAHNRIAWQTLVETATSLTSSGWWWWWWWEYPLPYMKVGAYLVLACGRITCKQCCF